MSGTVEQTERAWLLLEGLASSPVDQPLPEALLDDAASLDWGTLLEHGARHRLLPLLAARLEVSGALAKVPRFVVKVLLELLEVNRRRTLVFREEALSLAQRLDSAGVPAAFVKGLVLDSVVYRRLGVRPMSDIDVLIDAEHVPDVERILGEAGYVVGQYSNKARRIQPLDRRQQLMYRVSPDHLPRYARDHPDPFIGATMVDVSLSFTWHGAQAAIPVAPALTAATRVVIDADGRTVPALAPLDHFIYVVLHFFREGWMLNNLLEGDKGLNLIKCADVALLWQACPEIHGTHFASYCADRGVDRMVAWVLGNIDTLFGSTLLKDAGLAMLVDEHWLHSTARSEKEGVYFTTDFATRIRVPDKGSLLGVRANSNAAPIGGLS